jgi:hypothetical protein
MEAYNRPDAFVLKNTVFKWKIMEGGKILKPTKFYGFW